MKHWNRKKLVNGLIVLLVVFLIAFLTFRKHADTGYFNWKAELFSDQAGYYVYLPALFIYQFDAADLPENIVEKTGNGFSINEDNKIETKYSYGVSLMQAPFFLLIHGHALISNHKADGFSVNYHLVPILSAIFFSIIAFFFLYQFLGFYFSSQRLRLLTIALLFFGTNLYMYVVDYSGMSHIYSFALLSIFLYLFKKELSQGHRLKRWIFITLIFALLVEIRPTNIFLALLFFIDCNSFEEIKQRLRFFNLKKILLLFFSGLFVFMPQLIYWKFIHGQWIKYSYEGEGFIYWNHPQFLESVFSPHNGILLYSPIVLIMVLGLVFMFKKKIRNAFLISFLLLLFIYISASWHIYSFGCGFGCRTIIELYVVLALPLAYILQYFWNKKGFIRPLVFFSIVFAFVFTTQKLAYSYNKCFFGEGNWDFQEYKRLLLHKKYYHIAFEGKEQKFSAAENERYKGVWIKPSNVAFTPFSSVEVSCEFEGLNMKSEGIIVSFNVYDKNNKQLVHHEHLVTLESGEIKTEKCSFGIPSEASIDDVIAVEIPNYNNDVFILKRMTIEYE
jgi:hypothetical protein